MPVTDAAPSGNQIVLVKHRAGPSEAPSECLAARTVPFRSLSTGEVRVRNDFMQITAVVADLMSAHPGQPMGTYELNKPLWGGATGTVVESTTLDVPVGTVVSHRHGWRDETIGPGKEFSPIRVEEFPGAHYVLNQGVTAFRGVVDIAQVGDGDVVFVSGAAGGVGSLAGQIAKVRGASRVIGTAGTDEKAAYLVDTLGFDAGINYRDGDLLARLHEEAPEGIDVFFDTVGGGQFEAAVQAAAPGARFALCGALAGQVHGGDGASPRLDLITAIAKELLIKPFSTYPTPDQVQAWNEQYAQWLREGKIVFPHTVVEGGLKAAPKALDDLLRGKLRGNVIVRLRRP